MKANIIVRLKPAVHDPQGETISNALKQLGYEQAVSVRQGKFFELSLDTDSREEAQRLAQEVARRLLANPVLEVFEVEVQG
ncbi:MAG TPA: phosphoribosylformylglycinamidine synthase subunit PurS [Vicinamibacteria bacterium]|nr:phosphoribosylformylglycinamidine synthase subunit PurS [Vicinamibacteria bacterium]